MEIRKVQIENYDMIRELEELEFQIHLRARPDYFKHQETSYTKQEFETFLALPDPIALAAVCEGTIVGICFGKIEETPENSFCVSRGIAFVEDLVTLPEYRGRGIATSLIEKVRELAAEKGAEALELCVWGFNAEALELYRKLGMKVQYYRMEERLAGR